jgi:DNA topoisomerase-1
MSKSAPKQKKLVIIESPAKAKSLRSYLGDEYHVAASYGHVRDLPETYLAVDIEDGFRPTYTILAEKRKTVQKLKGLADEYSTIYLAADPDREGEAICWHLSQILDGSGRTFRRLMFNAITRDTVLKALKSPSGIDMNLVDAQQARRVMDRLVGYQVSSWLGRVMGRGRSAGRVQTVVLRMIQEREDEIEAFTPVNYWVVEAVFSRDGEQVSTSLWKVDGIPVDTPARAPHSADEGEALLSRALAVGDGWTVSGISEKERAVKPPPPFITSTLQQAASSRLNHSPSNTMRLAQQLYEGVALEGGEHRGLITYMRTDSVRISPEALDECRAYITARYGSGMLSGSPRRFRSGKGSQDAHEAIRPVSVHLTPEMAGAYLTGQQADLYRLIWNRFVVTQASDATVSRSSVTVTGDGMEFSCTGERLLVPGFTAIDPSALRLEKPLPELTIGPAALVSAESVHHATTPPARYSEAKLVAEMKKEGIGRPSTYVTTIETLKGRKYVERDGKILKPTELGTGTVRLLVKTFPHIFEIGFTASMEDLLDSVADGRSSYGEVLQKLNLPLASSLVSAMQSTESVRKELQEDTGKVCPRCGSPLVARWGRFGRFLACSAFPKCKYSSPLEDESRVVFQRPCPLCGGELLVKTGRYGRYLGCTKEGCSFTGPVPTGVRCPEVDCGGELVEKRSKKGRTFFSCSRYPDCKYVMWSEPVAQECPRCGFPILEKRKKGVWCPRCRKKISE